MQAEVAALALAPGTYYRDRDGQLHEVEFQRTPSVFLEGKYGINLTYRGKKVDGKWVEYDTSDRVTRLRRPEVDVVKCPGLNVFAARGKYALARTGGDRDYTHRALVWDDNILDYFMSDSSTHKHKYTTDELSDPMDRHAGFVKLFNLTVRTPHTHFEGRHSLPRILAILAVLEEADAMRFYTKSAYDLSMLPHKYNDVAIELPAGGHIPLDDRPEGVVGRASFHLGGARAPKRYFVL